MKWTWSRMAFCATCAFCVVCATWASGAATQAKPAPVPAPEPRPHSQVQSHPHQSHPQVQSHAQEPVHNRLTPEEEAAGWRLLFDGSSLAGWRGYRMEGVAPGWSATDGTLAFAPLERGDAQDDPAPPADLITTDMFADFELSLEWKVGPGGNSGVFFRLTETERDPYWTGPEMQLLDNAAHPDGRAPKTSAGANYGLHAPSEDVARRAGEWNHARIVVRGPRVEHWLNGARIVSYELWSDAWRRLVEASKFGEWPGYGMAPSGHVGLQDHGDPVWFRNVKIRESAPLAPARPPRSPAESPGLPAEPARSPAKEGVATLPS